ncbi:MAG: hypothetical protein AB3N14_10520, partial [Flavobacteriaceae bacterium]
MTSQRHFFCILIFFISALACAQKFNYARYVGEELPFKKVNRLVKDVKGFVWLATDKGLYRFDGSTFEDFNTSLRSLTIRSFFKSNDSSILFTNDTGIFRISYQADTPKIELYRRSDDLKYPTNLFQDSKNRLWVGQLNGALTLYPDKSEVRAHYRLSTKAKNQDIFVNEDKFGTIWVLVPETGIFRFDEIGRRFNPLGVHKDAKHFIVSGDELWVAADQLYKLRVDQNSNVVDRKTFAINKEVNLLSIRDSKSLLMATSTELYSFYTDSDRARIKKVFGSNDPHRVEKLPLNGINHLYFTSEEINQNDMIWVGMDDGLVLLWSSFFQTVSGMAKENVLGLNATGNGQVFVSLGMTNRVLLDGA